jgi:hypothetical protein
MLDPGCGVLSASSDEVRDAEGVARSLCQSAAFACSRALTVDGTAGSKVRTVVSKGGVVLLPTRDEEVADTTSHC